MDLHEYIKRPCLPCVFGVTMERMDSKGKCKKRECGPDMVAIRWIRKHSVYDGVVQFVSRSLKKEIDDHGRATVLWPRKGREPDTRIGTLEDDSPSQPKGK